MNGNNKHSYSGLKPKKSIPLLGRIDFNAPVILSFTIISLIVLIISELTDGRFGSMLAVRRASFLDPLMYVRMITHIFAHSGIHHYTSNFLLILIIGPMVEEKYGSELLAVLIGITAVVTGVFNIIFLPGAATMGASGIVFMLVVLGSFTNIKVGRIPLTAILVSVIYIGNEVITSLTSNNNIAYFAHILGGLCGAGFGYLLHGPKMSGKKD